MKIGLIGLPLAGKTTLFNLLCDTSAETSRFLSGRKEPNHGMARVPDRRIDWLSALYKPKRTIYAQMETTDLPGLQHGEGSGGNSFLQQIRQVDALVQVVRAFAMDDIDHVDGTIDPWRDLNNVQAELLLADLDMIEKRLERVKTGKKVTDEQKQEIELLAICRDALEEEKPLATLNFSEAEQAMLIHYGFLTQMPQLIVMNVDEIQFKDQSYPHQGDIEQWATMRGYRVVTLCAAMEEEIAKLPEEDRALFMEDLGIEDSGSYRLAREMYSLVGLISFFTVGEDEVRAWTIACGLNAKQAAGKIHSDLERGFIRAETAAYSDLVEHGSMVKLKEKGLLRLEGKEYPVKDGDILNIRFNV